MRTRIAPLALAFALALATALPATAQMWNFPDYMVPAMRGAPTSWISGDLGRGVNDVSGEENTWAVGYGRTGESLNFVLGLGIITYDFEDELTFGVALGGDVMEGESVTLGVQGGFGWVSPGDLTGIRVPIGLSIRTESELDDGGVFVPWVMPRLNWVRFSGDGGSDSEMDLGLSGGANLTLPSGFGFHAALDLWIADGDDPVTLGLGVHYLLGSSGN